MGVHLGLGIGDDIGPLSLHKLVEEFSLSGHDLG
jgi:hypothetical protein